MNLSNIRFLLALFIFTNNLFAQDYKSVDETVKKYPSNFENTSVLASKINADFKSESDKARAIFCWITYNVEYDVKTFLNPQPSSSFSYSNELEKFKKLNEIEEKIIYRTFRRKMAVCEGYSILFNHLAKLVGLNCEIVKGASKVINTDVGVKKIIENHAWNSVQIDGTWRLIDVTWGAGFLDYNSQKFVRKFTPIYFDLNYKNFFMNHFPISGTWNKMDFDNNLYLNLPLVYNKFFEDKLEMIEPKSGIIEASHNDKIIFKIKNISKSALLQVQNNRGDISKIEAIKFDNDIAKFELNYLKKDGKFLTFFIDGIATIAFKIIPRK